MKKTIIAKKLNKNFSKICLLGYLLTSTLQNYLPPPPPSFKNNEIHQFKELLTFHFLYSILNSLFGPFRQTAVSCSCFSTFMFLESL